MQPSIGMSKPAAGARLGGRSLQLAYALMLSILTDDHEREVYTSV